MLPNNYLKIASKIYSIDTEYPFDCLLVGSKFSELKYLPQYIF